MKSYANTIEKFPRLISLIIKTFSVYSQCFKLVAFLPLAELLIIVMKNEYRTIGFSSAGFWLSLITISLIFLHSVIRFLISEETITLRLTGFERLNRSIGTVFIDIFTIFQIIVSSFVES